MKVEGVAPITSRLTTQSLLKTFLKNNVKKGAFPDGSDLLPHQAHSQGRVWGTVVPEIIIDSNNRGINQQTLDQ